MALVLFMSLIKPKSWQASMTPDETLMPDPTVTSLKPSATESNCRQITENQARILSLDLAGVGVWQTTKMQQWFDDQEDCLSARLLRLSEGKRHTEKEHTASSINSSGPVPHAKL